MVELPCLLSGPAIALITCALCRRVEVQLAVDVTEVGPGMALPRQGIAPVLADGRAHGAIPGGSADGP
jgi:hypothetical protein